MTSENSNRNPAPADVLWTASDAAMATGGMVKGNWFATGLSIDTRTIRKGDLFIALKGDKLDGHAYIADALQKGAAAVMVSNIPMGIDPGAPVLLVADTMDAMRALAVESRRRCGGKMIAITGSVGKTGTKEMLAKVCASAGQAHASEKSYNNHWGVPFTLAAMNPGSDFGVFEIGMNHSGEITPLAEMVRPDIAIITTVEEVHLENFNSVEEIADAKSEIFMGLHENGVAIINRDNPHYQRMADAAGRRNLKILTFGEHEHADARLEECLLASNGSRIRATVMGEDVSFTLAIPGKHIAINALAVVLAARESGIDMKKIAMALETVQVPPGRGNRETVDLGEEGNPLTLIDESYNASKVAMQAAFKVLATVDPGRGGRRIAFLGDMYEASRSLDEKIKIHRELSVPLQAAGVNLVFTSGPLMKHLHDALPQDKRGAHEDDVDILAKIVPDVLAPGDVVLVKGSRGGGEKPRMQAIVEAVRKMPKKGGIKNAL